MHPVRGVGGTVVSTFNRYPLVYPYRCKRPSGCQHVRNPSVIHRVALAVESALPHPCNEDAGRRPCGVNLVKQRTEGRFKTRLRRYPYVIHPDVNQDELIEERRYFLRVRRYPAICLRVKVTDSPAA